MWGCAQAECRCVVWFDLVRRGPPGYVVCSRSAPPAVSWQCAPSPWSVPGHPSAHESPSTERSSPSRRTAGSVCATVCHHEGLSAGGSRYTRGSLDGRGCCTSTTAFRLTRVTAQPEPTLETAAAASPRKPGGRRGEVTEHVGAPVACLCLIDGRTEGRADCGSGTGFK